MYLTNRKVPDPFTRNHCVVLAFAELAGMRRAVDVLALAALAREAGILSKAGVAHRTSFHIRNWCAAAGLVSARSPLSAEQNGWIPREQRITLKTFASQHPRGLWFIGVPRHAVALVEGEIRGSYRLASRVQYAYEVRTLYADGRQPFNETAAT